MSKVLFIRVTIFICTLILTNCVLENKEVNRYASLKIVRSQFSGKDIESLYNQKKNYSLKNIKLKFNWSKRVCSDSLFVNQIKIKYYVWEDNKTQFSAYFLPNDELLCLFYFLNIDQDYMFLNQSIKYKKIYSIRNKR